MAAQPPPAPCVKPTCPPNLILCAPSCSTGYTCRLDVIGSTCQCPVASCVRVSFDTGAGNGDDDDDDSNGSKSSVVGPIIGAIAGLAAIALIAFFVIRKRRRRSSVLMLGQDDSNDSFSKRWNSSTGSEFAGHKDVIRIAYIPSMIGDSPSGGRPNSSALPAPLPQYSSLRDEDCSKHDSVGSHMSAVLDEAVVMAVTAKATPQVMKLGTIKATQSDLIQRSNTLHSSNSINRSTSQRRIADAKKNTATNATTGQRNPSPLAGGAQVASDDSDHESDPEDNGDGNTSTTQTRHMKRQSAGKQNYLDNINSSNNTHNPFMSPSELLTTGTPLTSPTETLTSSRHNYNGDTLVSRGSHYRNSNPFMTQSESATLVPDFHNSKNNNSDNNNRFSTVSSSAPSPALSPSSTFASIPIRLGHEDDDSDPLSPFADLAGGGNLRPWMSSGSGGGGAGVGTPLRDSTFSTMSDARSSTRGDGEEIMIFWGGQHNRDSKASNM
ncbi:hypothetical protein BGW39_007303 [Mortierella sp. 14UC]|nr:hypothetical protein BGW39_007303 [Mortierella sp. 14UC]